MPQIVPRRARAVYNQTVASRILVVDDEEAICSLLARILEGEGYEVLKAGRGDAALKLLIEKKPDLMVLDLNLPDVSGQAVYESVRQTPQARNIPILIITGRSVAGLSAQCLNGGADAFLSKPFDNREFLAQVRALLRRASVYADDEDVIEKGGLTIQSRQRRILYLGDSIAHLSPKEFDVLKELAIRSPEVVGKKELAAKVWGTSCDRLHPRTLDVHIRRIRQKIGADGARFLKTVPAIGYQWLSKPK
jgi:two-component system alkaline phosphatase synthesis response regulator PhoP